MNVKANIDELFERRITYPDFAPRDRLAALVGLNAPCRRRIERGLHHRYARI
jgi:hypothetical protein